MTYSQANNLPITALAETPQGCRSRAWWSVTEQREAETKLFAFESCGSVNLTFRTCIL